MYDKKAMGGVFLNATWHKLQKYRGIKLNASKQVLENRQSIQYLYL